MRHERNRRWLFILAGILSMSAGCRGCVGSERTLSTGSQRTSLNFELRGGFAYVMTPGDRKVEVAYLKETNVTGCHVPQPGTDLNVLDGTIVEPANNPQGNRRFDVGGAVISIENAPTNGPSANPGNHPPSPNRPANPANDPEWRDLKWVPRVVADHPSSSLHPNWRSKVDGRLVLTGGSLVGATPSTAGARDGMWEFRNPDGDAPYQQAITDTTNYSVDVNGDRVILTLTGARSSITRIVVTPSSAGGTVKLQLNGKHDPNAHQIGINDPIEHFCAFYQLMEPVPAAGKQRLPYFLGNPTPPAGGGGGQGSPGFYCPGDFF